MGLIYTIWSATLALIKKIDKQDTRLDEIISILKTQDDVLTLMGQLLQKIQADLQPPPAVALVIKMAGVTQGENNMLQVSDSGSVLSTLEADDALGNPGAKLDAAPTWSLSDPSFGSFNAAVDGMSGVVVLSGKLGTFKLHVDALAGGTALSADSDDVEVVVGGAALLKVSLSAQ